MTDYINKKVNFLNTKISVKISKILQFGAPSKIYLCSDLNNPSASYCLKIVSARNDDKITCNSINSEIIILLGLKERPNILQIIDYISQEFNNFVTYFILMEYCGNGSLADTMIKLSSEKNTFSENQIWKIIQQMSMGLAAIHSNKFAHRNVRPENVFITFEGNYKLCDFGSATNKFYENINSTGNIKNEIIFDISRNTSPLYRAPEQLNLYAGYPINEKVDIWALGVILYTLLFDSQPFSNGEGNFNSVNSNKNHQIVKGSIVLTDDMIQSYSPDMINLLKSLMNPNPTERLSAIQVLNYIDNHKDIQISNLKNENKISQIKKHSYSLSKTVSDATAKIFKRHSTQFWVIKLMSDELSAFPKLKYIKLLVNKAWSKTQKVVKLYENISIRPVHYFSFIALKSLYILHAYIFLGPIETIIPGNFNIDEYLTFFSNLWSARYSSGNYDKEENLKNSHVTKFIISYSELLKAKITYHKKYNYIENNFSIYNLSNKNFDFSLLIEKKFINDTLSLYSLIYQKFIQVPIIVTQISTTLDPIIQLLNEELISLFNFIFYLLVAYKNYYSTRLIQDNGNKNDSVLKIYDSQFLEITNKAKEYIEKYKKFRNDVKTKNKLINFPGSIGIDKINSNVFVEYLKSLDNNLKFFPNNDFNLKNFFINTNSIVGIQTNISVSKLIQLNLFFSSEERKNTAGNSSNKSNSSIEVKPPTFRGVNIENLDKINTNIKKIDLINNFEKKSDHKNNFNHSPNVFPKRNTKEFEFSDEKFLNSQKNFDFELKHKRHSADSLYSLEKTLKSIVPDGNINNLKDINLKVMNNQFDYKNQQININEAFQVNKNININKNNNMSLFNYNFFSRTNNKNNFNESSNENSLNNSLRKNTVDEAEKIGNTNVINILNDIFDSNKLPNNNRLVNNSQVNFNQIKQDFNNANQSLIYKPILNYDTSQFKKIVNEMDNKIEQQNNIINKLNNVYNNTNKISTNLMTDVNGSNGNVNNIKDLINLNDTKELSNQVQTHQDNYTNSNVFYNQFNGIFINNTINNQGKNINPSRDSSPFTNNKVNSNNIIPLNLENQNINMNKNPSSNNTSSLISINPGQNQSNINLNNIPGRTTENEEFNYESVKSQFPVSIINIQNNFNGVKVYSEVNVETLANEFLKEELSKKNLQWLISSKDIKYGKQIGFGGSSEVFIADYRGTEVAVKKLRLLEVQDENLKEFKREVSSLTMLRHPNLVLFMGAIAEKDNICIVTEYCAGGTLFNILHQKKDLIITWDLRVRILIEIAVGMNFLHTNSPPIIHRDLKSLNILLTERVERPADNTRIKISDFGLSKIIKTFDSSRETMTGQLGTCHWMAPEVIENKQYTLKADVFSYGIIIWEILSRKTPYGDMSQQQISFFVTVKKGRPDKNLIPPNTPLPLIKLMETCWDAEPNCRPSFEQIIDYLKKIKL